jgi:hypothetical protein
MTTIQIQPNDRRTIADILNELGQSPSIVAIAIANKTPTEDRYGLSHPRYVSYIRGLFNLNADIYSAVYGLETINQAIDDNVAIVQPK